MDKLLEYTIIATYMIFLLAVGFVFKRLTSNVSDYFRGGCRGTWWLIGVSSFMAGISAYTFTGASGVAYQAGWSVMIIYLANAAGFLLNYFWTAARFRQIRETTGPDVIRLRFNKGTEQLYSWFALPMGIIGTGLTLYSLAIFSSAVFSYKVSSIILVVGSVMLFYSVSGGSWAVMAADFVQGLVMLSMTILLTVLCLHKLGGIGGLFEHIAAAGLSSDYAIINDPGRFNRSFTWVWAAAMFVRQITCLNTMENAPRYFSAKDGREARKAALLSMVLMLGGALIWFIPAMTARIFYSDVVEGMDLSKPAESAFAVASINLFPPAMVGLMVVAMFAASMSSMDTGLNKNAAIFVKNIYPALRQRFPHREFSNDKMLLMSRIFTCFFGVLGIMCALLFASMSGFGQFELVLTVGALFALPMSIPLLLGLVVKKSPPWAGIGSIGFGFAASLTCHFSEQWFGYKPVYQELVFFIMAAGTLGFFVCLPFARFNRPEHDKKVENFFITMNTPVDFEKEVGGANDLRQFKLLGSFAIALGSFIALLFIPAVVMPDKGGLLGIVCPLAVGGAVAGLGVLMLRLGSRSPKK